MQTTNSESVDASSDGSVDMITWVIIIVVIVALAFFSIVVVVIVITWRRK
jgi:cytoskeletal protein RodZ